MRHKRSFRNLGFFSCMMLMRVTWILFVWNRRSIPFRFVITWAFDKLYMRFFFAIFDLLHFLCNFLNSLIFFNVRCFDGTLHVTLVTTFPYFLLLFFSIYHFFKIIDKLVLILFRSLILYLFSLSWLHLFLRMIDRLGKNNYWLSLCYRLMFFQNLFLLWELFWYLFSHWFIFRFIIKSLDYFFRICINSLD